MMNDTSKLPISRINELTETLNNLTSNIINVNDKFNRNYNMIKLEMVQHYQVQIQKLSKKLL